jgi:acyl transferase domain-containing protein/acyl carrier protein
VSAVIEDQLRRAITTIRSLRSEVETLKADRRPPIAIVGVGCRMPGGVRDIDGLWRALASGADAIVEVPPERWDIDAWFDADPDAVGRMNSRWGGFLDQIDMFDPGFFELSAREAIGMDPQQRLLLEVAWQALEDAALAPDSLKSDATGVFVGINASEYYEMGMTDPAGIDAHAISGGVASVAAGRLSYLMGFNGPAVAIDTACSSSLAAVHLAVQSLRTGESDLALAGGVYTVLKPNLSVGLSKLHMMAADGRCKSFDAAADGFVQGEGCGVVVLKRLADAVADRDPVRAVIRGSAMNQDGRSGSLTAPSRKAQVQVIKAALEDAGLGADQVGYVETHGTGTALGDPIEVHALADVLGRHREAPVVLGALKSNIGHLGPAAGIAGLIKAVAVVERGRIPPNLHFKALNPNIDLDGFPAVFPDTETAWPGVPGHRVAGVSSFGFSGTNVHVVLEAFNGAEDDIEPERFGGRHVYSVSARTQTALAEALALHADAVRRIDPTPAGRTALVGRRAFEHRVTVVGRTGAELADALTTASNAPQNPKRITTRARLGLMFTGQGAWKPGLGSELSAAYPVIAEVLEQAVEIAPEVRQGLFSDAPDLSDTAIAQPALFALQWALVSQLRAWGLEAIGQTGHSVGEIAAAASAGLIGWEEGQHFAAARGRLMAGLPATGGMAAVRAEPEAAALIEALADADGALSIAAINGPRSVVISGDTVSLDRCLQRLEREGFGTRRLSVSHAFHSVLMEPVLGDLDRLAPETKSGSGTLISTVTGGVLDAIPADHWSGHARRPVRFTDGVSGLMELGCTALLEVGPGTALRDLVLRGVATADASGERAVLAALGNEDAATGVLRAVAGLHDHGLAIDWTRILSNGRRARLPSYPFQRKPFWRAETKPAPSPTSVRVPGLRQSLPPADGVASTAFRLPVGLPAFPWLGDHRVHGRVVVPGAFQITCMISAWKALHPERPAPLSLTGLTFAHPLTVTQEVEADVWTVLADDGTTKLLSLRGTEWISHATGSISTDAMSKPGPLDLSTLKRRCTEEIAPGPWRSELAEMGIEIGPAFQGLRRMWRGGDEALGEVIRADWLSPVSDGPHPALLDACLQVAGGTIGDAEDGALLPIGIDRISMWTVGGDIWDGPLWVHARCTARGAVISTDLTVADVDGAVLMALTGLHVRRAPREILEASTPSSELFHELAWRPVPAEKSAVTADLVVVTGDVEIGRRLAALLPVRTARVISPSDDLSPLTDGTLVVDITDWNTDGDEASVACSLGIARQLIRSGVKPALLVVTNGAVSAAADAPHRPWQAARWGLAATLALEHPELSVRRCDAGDLASVAAEIACASGEDIVAWRAGRRLAARLIPAAPRVAQNRPPQLRGTVLITGGLGGVGRRLAEWSAMRGAEAVLLVGRSAGVAPDWATRLGVPVTCVSADLGQRSDVEGLFKGLDNLPPVRSILHAAGTRSDGLLSEITDEVFGTGLAAKARGAAFLDELSRRLELDHFILVSSIASVLGAAGQGSYAAANAMLDSLARLRRADGVPGLSVSWGRWADSGMAAALDSAASRRIDALGILPMADADALAALDRAITDGLLDPIVASVDWTRHAARHPSGQAPRLLSELVKSTSVLPLQAPEIDLSDLDALDAASRRNLLRRWLVEQAARILGAASPEDVDPELPLIQLGLDSLMAVELRNRVGSALGTPPSIAVLLGGASLATLAAHLTDDRTVNTDTGQNDEEWEEIRL